METTGLQHGNGELQIGAEAANEERFRPPGKEANQVDPESAHLIMTARNTQQLLEAIQTVKRSENYRKHYPPRPQAQKHARFMEISEYTETVALASYPRSGNTLVRHLLERITGIYTGSDTRPLRFLAEDLRDRGLLGESVVGKRVWVVKTHYPERQGWKYFPIHRCILLVRNPFNSIDSFFNQTLTGTHHRSIEPQEYERFSEAWEDHVQYEAGIWRDFHKYWLHKMGEGMPVLIVRFESLVADKAGEIDRILEFLCANDPDKTRLESFRQRAREVFSCDEHERNVYRPRSQHHSKSTPNTSHFSEVQQQLVLNRTSALFVPLGYQSSLGLTNVTPSTADAADIDLHCTTSDDTAGAQKRQSEEENQGNCDKKNAGDTPYRLIGSNEQILRESRCQPWKWEIRDVVKVAPLRP